MGLTPMVLVPLLLFIRDSSAICPAIDGIPPRFIIEPPASIVVSETVFQRACNVVANLVLPCSAAGFQRPAVTWFREEMALNGDFVMPDGTLAINITSSDISREGVFYHCVATNILGPTLNIAAQLRSRDVTVSHAFFDGFFAENERTLNILTVEGGAVSLICDVRQSNPTNLQIEWFADDILLEEDLVDNTLLYLNNGRNLYIQSLSAAQRAMRYHCEVVTFEGVRMRNPDTYIITRSLSNNGLTEYFGLDSGGIRLAEVGVPIKFVYVAAAIDGVDNRIDIVITCSPTSSLSYSIMNQYVVTVTPQMAPSFQPGSAISSLQLECTVIGNGIDQMIFGNIFFIAPLSILPLPGTGDDDFIMDRGREVGGGAVEYSCATSRPVPIRWFRNGGSLVSGDGIIVDNDMLTIQNPQTTHSGIYQCSAINNIEEISFNEELQRVWFLEVRDPAVPTVAPPEFCDVSPIATIIDPATCFIATEAPSGAPGRPTVSTSTTDSETTEESSAVSIASTSFWLHFSLLITLMSTTSAN